MALKPEIELGLLVLINASEPELDLDQFGPVSGPLDLGPHQAVDLVSDTADLADEVDLAAAIEALTISIQLAVTDDSGALGASNRDLTGRLLAHVGVNPLRAPDAIEVLSNRVNGGTTGDAVAGLVEIFDGRVTALVSPAHPDRVRLVGPAARVTAQMLDQTTQRRAECSVGFEVDPVSEERVTVVRLEACTNLTFDECRARIDPMQWTRCNPYFWSVTPIPPRVDDATGWCGGIKEVVGPGLNFRYYETDLSVRYIEQPRLAFSAFDLNPVRHDDRHVIVDRGCLGVIDEGSHRRVQMAKVYRIDDFDAPHRWVCPLWASQFVIAGWSCSMTSPMRRALRAWSKVERTVVDLGRAWHDVAHGCCEDEEPPRSKVGPMVREFYEVPLGADCGASWIPHQDDGIVVALPKTKVNKSFSKLTATKVSPGQITTTSRPVLLDKSVAGGAGSVGVQLGTDAAGAGASPGLYVGRLRDDHGLVDVPYSVYVTGVPV